MDALSVLGGVSKGVNEYHEQSVKEGVINRENAIRDYQIKKNADEEAFNNRVIPVSSVFPNYKEMPKTYENFKETMKSQGFGSGFIDGDIPSIRIGDAKEVMKLMASKQDLASKQINAVKGDLVAKYNNFDNMVNTGMDSEGKKYKPEELEEFKKQRDQAANAFTSILTMEGTSDRIKETIKENAKTREVTNVGKDRRTGRMVNQNKAGQLFYTDGSPFSGNEKDIDYKGEFIRETPTQSTSFGTINNVTPPGLTTNEREYERTLKDPKFAEYMKNRYPKNNTGGPLGGLSRPTGK